MFEEQRREQSNQQLHDIVSVLVEIYHAIIDTNNILTQNISAKLTNLQSGLTSIAHGLSSITQGLSAIHDAVRTVHTTVQQIRASVSQTRQETPRERRRTREQQEEQIPRIQLPTVQIPQAPNIPTPQPQVSQYIEHLRQVRIQQEQLQRQRQYLAEQLTALLASPLEGSRVARGSISIHPERILIPPGVTSIAPGMKFQALTSFFGIKLAHIRDMVKVQGLIQGTLEQPLQQLLLLPVVPRRVRDVEQFTSTFSPANLLSALAEIRGLVSDTNQTRLKRVIRELSQQQFSFTREQLLEAALSLQRSLLRGEQLLPPDIIERVFRGQIDHHTYYRLLASVFTANLPLTEIPRELSHQVKQIRGQLATQIRKAFRRPTRHGEPPEVEHIAKSLAETHGGRLLSFVSSFLEKPQSATQPFYTAHDILSLERIVKDIPGVPEGYSFIVTKKVLSVLSSLTSYHKHGQPQEIELISALIERTIGHVAGKRRLGDIVTGLQTALAEVTAGVAPTQSYVYQLMQQRIAAFQSITGLVSGQGFSSLADSYRELIAREGLLLFSQSLRSPQFNLDAAITAAAQQLSQRIPSTVAQQGDIESYLRTIYTSASQLHPLQLPYIYQFLVGKTPRAIQDVPQAIQHFVGAIRPGQQQNIEDARRTLYSTHELRTYLQRIFPEAILPAFGLPIAPTQDINQLRQVLLHVRQSTGALAEDLQEAFSRIVQLYSQPYISLPQFQRDPRKQAFDLLTAARLHATRTQDLFAFLSGTPGGVTTPPPHVPPTSPPTPQPRPINIYGPATINCTQGVTLNIPSLTISAQNVTITAPAPPPPTPPVTTPQVNVQQPASGGPGTGGQGAGGQGAGGPGAGGPGAGGPGTGGLGTGGPGTGGPGTGGPGTGGPGTGGPGTGRTPSSPQGQPQPLGLPPDVWNYIYRTAMLHNITRMLQERRPEMLTQEAIRFAAQHALGLLTKAFGPIIAATYMAEHGSMLFDVKQFSNLVGDIQSAIGPIVESIVRPQVGITSQQATSLFYQLYRMNWANILTSTGIFEQQRHGDKWLFTGDFQQFLENLAQQQGLSDEQRFTAISGEIYRRILNLPEFQNLPPTGTPERDALEQSLRALATVIAFQIPFSLRGLPPPTLIPTAAREYILDPDVLKEFLKTQKPEDLEKLIVGVASALALIGKGMPSRMRQAFREISAGFGVQLHAIFQEPISGAVSAREIQEQLMAFSKSLLYAAAAVFGFSKAVNRIAQGFPFHQIGYAIAYPTRLYADVEFMSRNLDKMIEYNERMNELYARRLEARELGYDIVTKMSLTIERLYTEPISRITSIIGRREFVSDLLSAGILSGASLALASMIMKNIGMPIGPFTAGLILAGTFPLFMRTAQTESVLQGMVSSTAASVAAYMALQPQYISALTGEKPQKLTDRQFKYARIAGFVAPAALVGAEVFGMAGLPYTASTIQSISSSALALSYGALVKGQVPPTSHIIGASIVAIGSILSTAIAEALGQQKIAQIVGNVVGLGLLGYSVAYTLYGGATAGIIGALIGAAVAGAVHLVSWLTEKPRDLLSIAKQMRLPGDEPR